jgi:outer membrane receptor protein involved in Fe transport
MKIPVSTLINWIKKYAFESALYINADHDISNKIALSYGLRYSMFYRLGQSTVNIYENDNPVLFNSDLQIYEKATHRHQVYDRNKVMKSYNYLEPRLSVAYQINDDQSIKASYNRMVQYLQLISNTIASA